MGRRGRKPTKTRKHYKPRGSSLMRALQDAIQTEAKRLYDMIRGVKNEAGASRYSPEDIRNAFEPYLDRSWGRIINEASRPYWPYSTTQETSEADRAIAAPSGPIDLEKEAVEKGFSSALAMVAYVLETLHMAYQRALNAARPITPDFLSVTRVYTLLRFVPADVDVSELFPELRHHRSMLAAAAKTMRLSRLMEQPVRLTAADRATIQTAIDKANHMSAAEVANAEGLEWALVRMIGVKIADLHDADPDLVERIFRAGPNEVVDLFTRRLDQEPPPNSASTKVGRPSSHGQPKPAQIEDVSSLDTGDEPSEAARAFAAGISGQVFASAGPGITDVVITNRPTGPNVRFMSGVRPTKIATTNSRQAYHLGRLYRIVALVLDERGRPISSSMAIATALNERTAANPRFDVGVAIACALDLLRQVAAIHDPEIRKTLHAYATSEARLA